MAFQKRLQQALAEKGMSQTDLSRLLGISSQSVSSWVNEGIVPRREKLEMLPGALGRPLHWFFLTDEEEHYSCTKKDGEKQFNPREISMLYAFRQLPEIEQDRMINLINARLEELDAYMNDYLSRRRITRA